jgi:hypothetical protein
LREDAVLVVVVVVVMVDTLSTLTRGAVDFFSSSKRSDFVALDGSVMAVVIRADVDARAWRC